MALVLIAVAWLPYSHPIACELAGMNLPPAGIAHHAECWEMAHHPITCHGPMACCTARVGPTSRAAALRSAPSQGKRPTDEVCVTHGAPAPSPRPHPPKT